ncbi:MAG: hypothetical protein ACREIV_06205, partial [Planctomycetaceae bacterium]
MEFEQRLERAIVRGQQTRQARGQAEAERAMTEEELKRLHTRSRIDLSEHIERCLKKLAEHFPGFQFETVVGEGGWGAQVSRDDFRGSRSRSARNEYSRLVMLVSPYSSAHIVELTAKATIRNKEIFNRTHYHLLSQVDVESFEELIDLWVLEYA